MKIFTGKQGIKVKREKLRFRCPSYNRTKHLDYPGLLISKEKLDTQCSSAYTRGVISCLSQKPSSLPQSYG